MLTKFTKKKKEVLSDETKISDSQLALYFIMIEKQVKNGNKAFTIGVD